ncbi:MogA/MoaB family molybdenum cofactor biosynthesis protein [Streptomyces sp. LX-29]|uniref:MogA/MoaB family molybdenum cofactor biosynthesis protein n=1 Tax=Streptomyces sp. LX-29 TaxID=2900152 RepID=UPI00240E98E6|nr:MogA/MoaB family molybdenum cofactor biosynthesis protein [Streptomyces sp. LX-29]WFB11609.1 MogA/MoaB family molybdenum cofactor biosynthesis protein [Streptomyces sp. LX-29]
MVVTASNRASAGVYPDRGGPLLVAGLTDLGFTVDGPRVVPDGDPVERALREAVTLGYAVVVTTGGTGISPTDRTPEATRRVLDYEVPGIAEAIRAEGLAKVPTAALSRGLAGVAGSTLIVNLPGSTGGVRDGLAVLGRLLTHAVEQLHGGDHASPAAAVSPGEPADAGSPGGSADAGPHGSRDAGPHGSRDAGPPGASSGAGSSSGPAGPEGSGGLPGSPS